MCVEGLTVGTVVLVHLLEASGTGAGVRLVAGQTQVAAATIVSATAVPATCTDTTGVSLPSDRMCTFF